MKIIVQILLSALGGLVALAASATVGDNNLGARILLSYCLSVFLFLLIRAALDNSVSVLTVVIAYYHIAMLLFPGMLHCAQGWFPFYEASYSPAAIFQASVLLLLYSTCFVTGHALAMRRKAQASTVPNPGGARLGETTIILLSVSTIGVSLASMAAVGFQAFLLRRGDFALLGEDPAPAFLILTNLPRAASLCAFLIVAHHALRNRSVLMMILAAPIGALTLLANNPLVIARFQLFAVAFNMLFSAKLLNTRVRKVSFAAVLVVGQIIVLPLVDTITRGEVGTEISFRPLQYIAEHGDFDGLQSTINTYLLVDMKGVSYGKQLLGAILTFVPRTLWPEKPLATGQTAGEALGFAFTNLSSPLPAEIYVDFGVPGLILISFVLGYLVRQLDSAAHLAALDNSPMTTRLYYGGLIGYATILCRGSLLAVAAPIYLFFGVLWIWRGAASRKLKAAN